MDDIVSDPGKIAATCLVIMISVFDAIALRAIRSTRRTPVNCRFMSVGLICMDWLFMVLALVRICSTNYVIIKLYSERLCYTIGSLVFSTIALMSYDRYLLLTKPHFYTKYLLAAGTRIVGVFWTIQVVLLVGFRLVFCAEVYGESRTNGPCYTRTGQVFGAFTVSAMAIATICCVRIFRLIREKQQYVKTFLTVRGNISPGRGVAQEKTKHVAMKMRNDERSAYLVFSYMFSILVGMLGLVVYLVRSELGIGAHYFSATLALTMAQCIVDPLLYVFWFREGRMQLIGMFVCMFPKLKNKVDRMRIEIYDIVLSTKKTDTI